MTPTRPTDADDERDDEGRARPGCADAGRVVNPLDADAEDAGHTRRPPLPPLPIPSPGIPVTAEEYDRLKEQAETRRDRQDAPAHEDRPPGSTDR